MFDNNSDPLKYEFLMLLHENTKMYNAHSFNDNLKYLLRLHDVINRVLYVNFDCLYISLNYDFENLSFREKVDIFQLFVLDSWLDTMEKVALKRLQNKAIKGVLYNVEQFVYIRLRFTEQCEMLQTMMLNFIAKNGTRSSFLFDESPSNIKKLLVNNMPFYKKLYKKYISKKI